MTLGPGQCIEVPWMFLKRYQINNDEISRHSYAVDRYILLLQAVDTIGNYSK